MTPPPSSKLPEAPAPSSMALLIFAWIFVGIPLAWGVAQTLSKAMALFR